MASIQTGITVGGNMKGYQGLSTDAKPITNIGGGSTFYELDTGNAWIYDLSNINPITSNGWWVLI